MTTTIESGGDERIPAPPRRAARRQDRAPKQNFETWSWYFMRVSGLVLVFMALLHFAITHIINDVVETDAVFVAERWDNPLWRLYDWVLLALALLHGLNGVRWIIEDYVRAPTKRAVTKAVVYGVAFTLFAYGTFVHVTFDGRGTPPARHPATPPPRPPAAARRSARRRSTGHRRAVFRSRDDPRPAGGWPARPAGRVRGQAPRPSPSNLGGHGYRGCGTYRRGDREHHRSERPRHACGWVRERHLMQDPADRGATADGVAISLQHLRKEFPGAATAAVGDLSFDVHEGELVALVGPSGCGKTTTLKMINRIIEPTSGRIEVLGQDATTTPVHQLRRGIGYVIQQVGLFPHRTIAANIATVPRLLGWDRARIRERTDELVELVGLDPSLLGRYPAALSGGQQQRVGVARALAADPPILLMDEPYSAVDPIVRARLQDELVQLQRRLHKTIVFVTHDIDEAIKLGDRIAILNVGGVLEQLGPPADVLKEPANAFVAEFLGDERGLKRLALVTVAELPLVDGPVVDVSVDADEARAAMARHGTSWFGVTEDGRLLGSVEASLLTDGAEVATLPRERFTSWCTPDTPVRQALDTLVTSRTNRAVVLDDDERYLGMLDIDAISRGVVEEPIT